LIEIHKCPMSAKIIESQKENLANDLIPVIPEKLETL
jgi:hypothetical protein